MPLYWNRITEDKYRCFFTNCYTRVTMILFLDITKGSINYCRTIISISYNMREENNSIGINVAGRMRNLIYRFCPLRYNWIDETILRFRCETFPCSNFVSKSTAFFYIHTTSFISGTLILLFFPSIKCSIMQLVGCCLYSTQ